MAVDTGFWCNWGTHFVLDLRPHRNYYGACRSGTKSIATCRLGTEGQVKEKRFPLLNGLHGLSKLRFTGYHLRLASNIFYDAFSTILKSPRAWVTKSGTMGEGLGPLMSSSVVIPKFKGMIIQCRPESWKQCTNLSGLVELLDPHSGQIKYLYSIDLPP